jgi:hypothetical protein
MTIDVRAEFLLGGTWTDVTDSVRVADGFTIERGRKSEQDEIGPQTCAFKVDNGPGSPFGVGWASPRNPLSPFYGQLRRNTQCRVSVPYGSTYLRLPGHSDYFSTPDSAALSVTGDIDVRIDLTLDNWYGAQGLAAKYLITGNQRSWSLELDADGVVRFTWSTDGTFSGARSSLSLPITPAPHQRLALRFTLDVDNGSGGRVETFYTAATIDGPWTVLSSGTFSGTTSIFDSTAPVVVGDGGSSHTTTHVRGKVHAFELRSGIGGTVVASLDARAGLFGVPYLVGTPVQQAAGVSASAPLTVTHAVPVGDQVEVTLGTSGAAAVVGLSDSKGNTYSPVASATGGTPQTFKYRMTAATALAAGDTITPTFSTAGQAYNVIAFGCSGVSATDKTNPNSGTSTTPSATSAALSSAYQLAVGAISNGNGGGSPTWAAGWTVLATAHNGSTQWTSAAYKTVAATTAVTASATIVSAAWTALVATFTPRMQRPGAGPFLDGTGNVWTANGDAVLDDRDYRFWGETYELPPRWDLSGNDATAPVSAAGLMRRLDQGASPLKSSMTREHTNPARTNIVEYWPMEDASDAASIASGLAGHSAMKIIGVPQLGNYNEWTASDALPTMGTGRLVGQIAPYTETGEISTRAFVFVQTAVAAETGLIQLTTTGTARTWEIRLQPDGDLRTRAWADDGSSLLDNTTAFSMNSIGFCLVVLELTQSGSDVTWKTLVQDFTNTDTVRDGAPGTSTSGTVTSQTIGRGTVAVVGKDQGLTEVVVGHLAVADDIGAYADTLSAIAAWNGERPSTRVSRLCSEENIAFVEVNGGELANTVTMGDQKVGTLKELLQQCAETDLGMVHEARDQLTVVYRTRTSLYNQQAALTVAADQLGAAPEPTDDDQLVRNDITVSRIDGSKARAVQTSGPLNVNDPADDPDGAGRYDTSPSISIERDDQLLDQAAFRVNLGTVDEYRYPTTVLQLHEAPFATDPALHLATRALDLGDRLVITDPPAGMPPDDISQLVQGYTEFIGQFEHTIAPNCAPESPWRIGVLDDTEFGRADTDGSTLASAVSSSATSLTVSTTVDVASAYDTPVWVDSAAFASDFPFDIRAGGEVMTVTAIASALADAFGRTVGNGVGTADSGQVYATSGGAASDYAVGSGFASVTNPSTGVAHAFTIAAPSPDFDLYVDVATNALATGSSLFGGPVARWNTNTDWYMARLDFTTAQAIVLTLRKRVANSETQLATYTVPLTHVATTFYRVRFQVIGGALRAKAWLATNPEPPAWAASVTDTDLTAAQNIGARCFSNAGNTNVNPQIRFDNLQVINPQTFTVTRAVNGVTKAQAAGTDVRLAQPLILAL